ncbi:MAG: ribonuclease E/G, partial [Asticcacaulis sp.]
RLRLSGLAGLVVVDLIGRKHDAERLRAILTSAFAPETVIAGPIGKFGTLEFVRPWGACPAVDLPAALQVSDRLLREAARLAAHRPGRSLTLRATPDVLDIIRPLLKGSLDPLSALIRLESGPLAEVIAS